MNNVELIPLAPKFDQAVRHWQRHWIQDWDFLLEHWEKFFSKDEPVCICAKMEIGAPDLIQIGDHQGEKKRRAPSELTEEEARQLLAIIRAQASTEFGSIQQHSATLAQAPTDEDRMWILRVMAEELRHGTQMFHLLITADWSKAAPGVRPEDMVEEALSMQTGSHVLDAFNLDYDSFLDNRVFAAVIDRVGKWQLTMQKVCAYKPFADSMPPMLREEAFHLAAGVIPMRRWAQEAGRGDPLITMTTLQRSFNKWWPRGLEMFGDERGGGTNIGFGFKDMTNREAQDGYIEEVRRMVRDINQRFLRARYPAYTPSRIDHALTDLEQGFGHNGTAPDDILVLPDRRFFRRKGEPAWSQVGTRGESFADVDAYLAHVAAQLPEAYLASRDMRLFTEMQRRVAAGEIKPADASKKMPKLKRVGGGCPCSNSARWVVDEPEVAA